MSGGYLCNVFKVKMLMGDVRYKDPPLLEAICVFNFSNEEEWDWTFPGLFFNEIKDTFSVKKEIHGMAFEFNLPSKNDPQIQNINSSVDRLQFWNKENTQVVQIAERRLIINQRRPYTGWDNYKPFIIKMLSTYLAVTNQKSVRSIGIRYLNRIETLSSNIDLRKYFHVYPAFPSHLQTLTGPLSIQSSFEVQIDKYSAVLKIVFGNQIQKNRSPFWILDLDLTIKNDPAISTDNLSSVLEMAHDKIIETFESCITDELRKEFKVKENGS